ncbi:CU044_2847 family protein [Streptomyces sp. NPDC050636]|uniref:CU044_2847 family protein n=1 Tax=Streptomyces sp. NPDC050636 TaxID=3154510 RepID=UPI003440A8FA
MGDLALRIDDDTVVWLRADPPGPLGADAAKWHSPPPSADQRPDGDGELELPEAFGSARPVSVDSRMSRAVTRGGEVLEEALRPLSGVLGQIHRSISSGSHRPDEVTVQFGVTLGSDLKLGVFSGKGEASFTVSATWNLGGAGEQGTTPGAGGTREAGGTSAVGAASEAGGAAP